jgi:hypothetical protein
VQYGQNICREKAHRLLSVAIPDEIATALGLRVDQRWVADFMPRYFRRQNMCHFILIPSGSYADGHVRHLSIEMHV